MDFETFESYDFVFCSPDQDGKMCRYEAVLSFAVAAGGPEYLVYADAAPDEAGEEATYASVLADPAQARAAQYAVEHGAAPKNPPVLDLRDIVDEEEWALVERVLDEELADD